MEIKVKFYLNRRVKKNGKNNKKDNITEYYIDDRLLLTITELGNDNYIVENTNNKLKGYCKNIDKYKTEFSLEENYKKGKNNRWYKTKELFKHNSRWFVYILQQKGFVLQTLSTR
mgnify:CR=1 FL=1